jgi:putative SOS response-associated peptidase YedK
MCSRYDLDISTPAKVAGRIAKERWLQQLAEDRWTKYASHDVRPETMRPVVAGPAVPKLGVMRWGWRLTWMRGPLINPRWETVPTKKILKRAFAERRCVVPATGYFEWQRDAKFMFRPGDGGFIRIAGLWQEVDIPPAQVVGKFPHPDVDHAGIKATIERRFLVLTRPGVLYGRVRDRTPLILSPEAAELWLDPKAQEAELFDAAGALNDCQLVMRRVTGDTAAGKVDGPHLVEPLDYSWPWV